MTGIGSGLASNLDWPDIVIGLMLISLGIGMFRDEIAKWWRGRVR